MLMIDFRGPLTLEHSAGSLGGGAMTSLGPGGWRYAFWMMAALHGATALGFGLFYWPSRRSDYPKMSIKHYIWLFDPIGSFFFICGSTLLLLALNWGGGKYAWSTAHVAATFSLGIVLLLSFCFYRKYEGDWKGSSLLTPVSEWKGRDDGLVPHVLFRKGPNYPLAVCSLAIEGYVITAQLVLLKTLIVSALQMVSLWCHDTNGSPNNGKHRL